MPLLRLGFDITAVDTLGDDDVTLQPFYPKEMKHDGGFDVLMSKLFFCFCIQIIFVYIRFVFDEGEYVICSESTM